MSNDVFKLLKLKKVGLYFGYLLIVVLVYVCLIPNPPDTSGVVFGDKIAHFVGYSLLFLWFAQIYQRVAQLKLALALILLGISVEFAQGFTGYRAFEYADMLANTTGVIIGWILAATPLASILYMLEQHLIEKKLM